MSTIENIKSRVRKILEDEDEVRFDDALLTEALQQALTRIDENLPRMLSAEITVETESRDQPLNELIDCLYLIRLIYPSTDNGEKTFEPGAEFTYTLQDGIPLLHFYGEVVPKVGSTLRADYAAQNTIEGLNGSTVTSLNAAMQNALVNGAAGYACWLRAGRIAHAYTTKKGESAELVETGRLWLSVFEHDLTGIKVLQQFGYPPGFSLDRWDKNGGIP